MTSRAREWVVLFGGAGREQVIDALRRTGDRIRAIVIPAGTRHARLERAIAVVRAFGVPVIETDRDGLVEALAPCAGCALLSVGFPFVLPPDVLRRHQQRLNIHPTLLPKYRGAATGAYVLMHRDAESGSTVHLLDDNVDGGAIVAQSRVPVSRFDTVRSLQRKVYASEPALLIEALRRLDAGMTPVPQESAAPVDEPLSRTPADSEIDPHQPLLDLFDRIRACDPDEYPAFFFVDGQKVCIKLWRPDRPIDEADLL